ncbi:hydroxyacylglutathione hydrolase [Sphingomonas sp. RB56-2]|uniref:Hydroxyacylglutathione hydrolase n=1 Tax=Sphingomonas brevis TaxID=2908206 RepID=A0ABT0S9L7_9SPHN|nr:hydroxyacylglutathione hydrolase [Sphingomonas brevis]MCL6741101.1 hydroxyacylglutathione hydrolase [Sphingomonas brevis]
MTDRLQIEPVLTFKDNYVWMIHDGSHAVVVDPGVAQPVVEAIEAKGLELAAIIITHLHYDHAWGVPGLLQKWPVPVYGPRLNDHDRVTHPPFPEPGTVPLDCVTHVVGEGDVVILGQLDLSLKVLAVPGHTKGHIVYVDEQRHWLFSGDTLFGGGCGKVFGGSMRAMLDSLDRLATLPPQTQVYCAHEYTLANLGFALETEPSNPVLAARIETESGKRELGLPTLPSTIGVERATNPFLRVMEPEVLESLRLKRGIDPASRLASFEALRSWKNEHKG